MNLRIFGYVNEKKQTITDWHGETTIATNVRYGRHVHHNNFGAAWVSVVAKVGERWHYGRYYFEVQQCITLRPYTSYRNQHWYHETYAPWTTRTLRTVQDAHLRAIGAKN